METESVISVEKDASGQEMKYYKSIRYFESLKGKLELIKNTVNGEGVTDSERPLTPELREKRQEDGLGKRHTKNIHTTHTSNESSAYECEDRESRVGDCENGKTKPGECKHKDEVVFREPVDLGKLEEELMKTIESERQEKVYITKKEKKCLEEIGNLAGKIHIPLDEKQQRYFEKDKKKFKLKTEIPPFQEHNKKEKIPDEIITNTQESPVNITSTELDGLKGYLLQLKELITRRETAWAKTTERDYSQKAEITRLKNEVTNLRMLCDKRTREIKERNKTIEEKDEEIKTLGKKMQILKVTLGKCQRKVDTCQSDILKPEVEPYEPRIGGNLFQKKSRNGYGLSVNRSREQTSKQSQVYPTCAPRGKDETESKVFTSLKKTIESAGRGAAPVFEEGNATIENIQNLEEKLKKIESTLHEEVMKDKEMNKQKSKHPSSAVGRPVHMTRKVFKDNLKQKCEESVEYDDSESGVRMVPSTSSKKSNYFSTYQGPSSIYQHSFFQQNSPLSM